MNLLREPIKNWFGFTRRERRSTFVLLLIILFAIALRYSVPQSSIAIEETLANQEFSENHSGSEVKSEKSSDATFRDTKVYQGKQSRSYVKKTYNTEGKRIPFVNVKSSGFQTTGSASGQQRPLLEINSCDSAALERLPGIGPVLSARIIKYRHLLGGFARIDQLKEVYGLPEETFEAIKGRLYADTILVTRVNINSATYKELSHVHYLEHYELKSILKYRELKGRINSINDLTDNKLITAEKAMKVAPYFRFD
jgi:DNA uptake protein ComE-like DNA-binding protein